MNNGEGGLSFCFCFLFFILFSKSCGSEGKEGRKSLNQKCTCGRGGEEYTMTKKKNDNHTKIPNTKNTERKALFKGRVYTEAIQDQDSLSLSLSFSHTPTHTHICCSFIPFCHRVRCKCLVVAVLVDPFC